MSLPTLAAFGPVLQIQGPIYAYRLVAIVTVLLAIASRPNVAKSGYRQLLGTTALAWVGTGVILGFFAKYQEGVFNELVSITLGIVVVWAVVRSGDHIQRFRDLRTGWLIAFVITGALGTREALTGVHMSNYFRSQDELQYVSDNLIASTFSNPNLFGLFLAAGAPALITLLLESQQWTRRALLVSATLWWLWLLSNTGSRLCLAAAALAFLTWLVLDSRTIRRVAIGSVAIGAVALFAAPLLTGAFDALPEKVRTFSLGSVEASTTSSGASGNIRVNLIKSGMHMVLETGGLGVGPANFAPTMSNETPYYTRGIVNPHNGIIEIVAQYGLVTFALAMLCMLLPLFRAMHVPKARAIQEHSAKIVVAGSAIGFVPLALANSSFWVNPVVWIFVAMFVLAAIEIDTSGSVDQSRSEEIAHS